MHIVSLNLHSYSGTQKDYFPMISPYTLNLLPITYPDTTPPPPHINPYHNGFWRLPPQPILYLIILLGVPVSHTDPKKIPGPNCQPEYFLNPAVFCYLLSFYPHLFCWITLYQQWRKGPQGHPDYLILTSVM